MTAALVMWNNDKNFDGKISLEERQQRFNELDVNHDNKLDLSEQMQDLNLSMPLWMGEPSVRNNHFNGFLGDRARLISGAFHSKPEPPSAETKGGLVFLSSSSGLECVR